jgi:acyl-CoA dehydrogenase
MDFALTENQQAIVASVAKMCAGFDARYWRDCDDQARFPEEFVG